MADPFKPVKIETFGGLRYNANEVQLRTATRRNGKTYYTLRFKSGAKLEYPEQAKSSRAAINIGGSQSDETWCDIVGCMGAKFTGSEEKRDNVVLRDCSNCYIDVATNKNPGSDFVIISDDGSKGNIVKMDKNDALCEQEGETVYDTEPIYNDDGEEIGYSPAGSHVEPKYIEGPGIHRQGDSTEKLLARPSDAYIESDSHKRNSEKGTIETVIDFFRNFQN